MHYYEVAPTQIIRSGSDSFTYSSDQPLHIGQIVRISIGKKTLNGLVIDNVKKAPTYSVKPIDAVIESVPIPLPYIELARWLSVYYKTPLALSLQSLLPAGLHKERRKTLLFYIC